MKLPLAITALIFLPNLAFSEPTVYQCEALFVCNETGDCAVSGVTFELILEGQIGSGVTGYFIETPPSGRKRAFPILNHDGQRTLHWEEYSQQNSISIGFDGQFSWTSIDGTKEDARMAIRIGKCE